MTGAAALAVPKMLTVSFLQRKFADSRLRIPAWALAMLILLFH